MSAARLALVVIGIACAPPAEADEGETAVGVQFGVAATTAQHPAVDDAKFDTATPLLVVGLGLDHGIFNWLDLGVRADVGAAGNVSSQDASVSGAHGTVVSGLLADGRAGLTGTARLDMGFPLTAALRVTVGPTVGLWSASALADPARLDAGGRPARLPIAVADELIVGGFLRCAVALQGRFFDTVTAAVEPYVSIGWSGEPEFVAGLVVAPSWTFAAGPE